MLQIILSFIKLSYFVIISPKGGEIMDIHHKLMFECFELATKSHNEFYCNNDPENFSEYERELKKINSLSLLDQAFTCAKLSEYHYSFMCDFQDDNFEHLLNEFKIFNATMHKALSKNFYYEALDHTFDSFHERCSEYFDTFSE